MPCKLRRSCASGLNTDYYHCFSIAICLKSIMKHLNSVYQRCAWLITQFNILVVLAFITLRHSHQLNGLGDLLRYTSCSRPLPLLVCKLFLRNRDALLLFKLTSAYYVQPCPLIASKFGILVEDTQDAQMIDLDLCFPVSSNRFFHSLDSIVILSFGATERGSLRLVLDVAPLSS